jgi:hypothetical protein
VCKFICLFLFSLLFLSCSNNTLEIKQNGAGYKILVYSGLKKPIYEIDCNTSYEETKKVSGFTEKTLKLFEKIYRNRPASRKPGQPAGETDAIIIDFNNDYRRLFFSLGIYSLYDFKNDLIKFGLIQREWKGLISGSINNEKYGIIPIRDFQDLFTDYKLNGTDLSQLYPYMVNYLLKEILFVSIQEVLERPGRYLTENELGTVFCEVVVLPETVEFTDYLVKKFGYDRVFKIAKVEYSKQSWKSILGEEINETEEYFSKEIKSRKYNGLYENKEFTDKLDAFLKLYNKITKPTLFRK